MSLDAIAARLTLLAVAVPFLFAITDSPVANFWPMLASWMCAGVLLLLAAAQWRGGPRPGLRASRWGALLAGGLALAAVVASAIGLAQYAFGDPGLAPWVHPSVPGQAVGNLRQRNQQGTLLSLGAWAVLWWLLHARPRAPLPGGAGPERAGALPLAAGAAVVALVWMAAGAAATASRTVALEWVLLVALVVLWRGSAGPRGAKALRVAVAALAVFLVAAWALPELLWKLGGVRTDALFHRFATDSQPCTSRRVLWSNMLTLIGQRPWLGWGWDELDYAHYITLFPGDRFCVLLDNAHNLPLHLAVELGLPAAALLCGVVLLWVLRARPWAEVQPARQLAWGVLAIIGLHSLLEYPLWYGPFQVAALFAVALLWRWPDRTARRPAAHGAAVARALAASAVLLWAGCAAAAWDYFRVSQLYRSNAERAAPYRDNVHAKVTWSLLFDNQLRFARLTTTPLTPANAEATHALALDLLHYSPEPRVIQRVIESAQLLGMDDAVAFHTKRYRLAYPADYARWAERRARGQQGPAAAASPGSR